MAQTILTDAGFDRPTLAETLQLIGDQLSNVVGPINRNPDSGIGQIIGTFAEALGVSYEVAEELFNSRFIRSASGLALDAFGDWLGLPRRARTNTSVPVILYGDNGALVNAGALASYANHNFAIDYDTTISTSNTTDITFRVSTSIATGDKVGIRVQGINYQVTVAAGQTAAVVAGLLATQIDTAGSSGATQFDAAATGADIRITSNNLSAGFSATIASVTTAGRLSITNLGTPSNATAVDTGPIVVPAGQLVTPVTAVAGWTGITNPIDGATGSDRESDTDYRNRLLQADGSVNGLSTPPAIKRAVSQVSGVSAVALIVNNTMATVASQPPKSYQVVVEGGDPRQIAQAIYTAGGAGIETYGTISETYTDTDGEAHLIYFSRMTTITYNVQVDVKYLETEEGLTASAAQVIEQAVRTYFAGLGLGEDVVPQRMIVPIYSSTTGIAEVAITIKNSAGTVVPPVNGVISVPATNVAVVGTVTVTGV